MTACEVCGFAFSGSLGNICPRCHWEVEDMLFRGKLGPNHMDILKGRENYIRTGSAIGRRIGAPPRLARKSRELQVHRARRNFRVRHVAVVTLVDYFGSRTEVIDTRKGGRVSGPKLPREED